MGARLSNWRAEWQETWADPLAGSGWQERRRLVGLARRGERIVDARDAELVRAHIAWIQPIRRYCVVAVSLVLLSVLLLGAALVLAGHPLLALGNAAWACLFAGLLVHSRREANAESRTAESNSWDEPANPGRLAIRGERIVNAHHAERVRDYIDWVARVMYRLRRPAFVVGIIVGVVLILSVVIEAFSSHYVRAFSNAVELASYAAFWVIWRHELSRHRSTSAANDWDVPRPRAPE